MKIKVHVITCCYVSEIFDCHHNDMLLSAGFLISDEHVSPQYSSSQISQYHLLIWQRIQETTLIKLLSSRRIHKQACKMFYLCCGTLFLKIFTFQCLKCSVCHVWTIKSDISHTVLRYSKIAGITNIRSAVQQQEQTRISVFGTGIMLL